MISLLKTPPPQCISNISPTSSSPCITRFLTLVPYSSDLIVVRSILDGLWTWHFLLVWLYGEFISIKGPHYIHMKLRALKTCHWRMLKYKFVMGSMTLRVSLDYSEEVQPSRIFREWNNMIGYEMYSSPAGSYTTAKTSPVDNFKHGWNNDIAVNMNIIFARGVHWRSSVLGNLEPSNKKPDLWRTTTHGILIYCLFVHLCPPIPIVASNDFVLGWSSWPTGALVHRSVN